MRNSPLALLAATILAFACVSCRDSAPKEPQPDVIILQTGRLRGNVYPPGTAGVAPLQHYAKVAGYIQSVRDEAAKTGAKVFVVDLGDSFAGSFASEVTQGRNMVQFFNAAGYDAICLGNLDAVLKPEWLQGLKAAVLSPFVDADGKPIPADAQAEREFKLDGIGTLQLFANFYGDTAVSTAPHRFPSGFMNVSRGVQPVRDYSAFVRPEKTADLTLFAWMKFEAPDRPPEKFLQTLNGLGVDAILAHRVYTGSMKDVWLEDSLLPWDPPVAQNILRENRGFTVGRLDLKRNGSKWEVLKHQLVPMNEPKIVADAGIAEKLRPLTGEINAADRPVATLAQDADKPAIMMAVLKAFGNVENAGAVAYSLESVRTSLPAGELRASQLFEALPWTGAVQRLSLTRDEVTRLADIKALVIYVRSGSTADRIDLVTSRYFAMLIANYLELPADRITTVAESEADFIRESNLRDKIDAFLSKEFAGWEPLK
jgi:hypothetical protein